jgi:hypothetical protein
MRAYVFEAFLKKEGIRAKRSRNIRMLFFLGMLTLASVNIIARRHGQSQVVMASAISGVTGRAKLLWPVPSPASRAEPSCYGQCHLRRHGQSQVFLFSFIFFS